VRRGAIAERNLDNLAGFGVEPPEFTAALRRVPDTAVGRGRDIVRA
jgi:hypothetical protein